jgi:S-adenosylmethionine:tRNA ribosyltransferase-isomerase
VTTSALDLNLYLPQAPAAASAPAEYRGMRRDEVRLMVLDKATGAVRHAYFYELPNFLSAGDVLVVNASATIPGRLHARYGKERLFLHLATKLSDTEYIVERRTANGGPDRRAFRPGDVIEVVGPGVPDAVCELRVEGQFHPNSRLWRISSEVDLFQVALAIGSPIRYNYVPRDYDASDYQTVFARIPGSAEMPSAGRPFTKDVLRNLARKGVKIRWLVLHTGVSSHEVEVDLNHHPVLPEWYDIPQATAQAINEAIAEGRRVIAVGTTVVRALESAAQPDGTVAAGSNWTTHLVTPATPPKVVTGLVTGMHDSQSSHLALMYAFVRPAFLRDAYQDAVKRGYLWHEFGDVSLVL